MCRGHRRRQARRYGMWAAGVIGCERGPGGQVRGRRCGRTGCRRHGHGRMVCLCAPGSQMFVPRSVAACYRLSLMSRQSPLMSFCSLSPPSLSDMFLIYSSTNHPCSSDRCAGLAALPYIGKSPSFVDFVLALPWAGLMTTLHPISFAARKTML